MWKNITLYLFLRVLLIISTVKVFFIFPRFCKKKKKQPVKISKKAFCLLCYTNQTSLFFAQKLIFTSNIFLYSRTLTVKDSLYLINSSFRNIFLLKSENYILT